MLYVRSEDALFSVWGDCQQTCAQEGRGIRAWVARGLLMICSYLYSMIKKKSETNAPKVDIYVDNYSISGNTGTLQLDDVTSGGGVNNFKPIIRENIEM